MDAGTTSEPVSGPAAAGSTPAASSGTPAATAGAAPCTADTGAAQTTTGAKHKPIRVFSGTPFIPGYQHFGKENSGFPGIP